MRLQEDPDEFLKETLCAGLEERLTARSSGREPAELDRLRVGSALEMVMKKKRDALVKDSSDINALLDYFSCLQNFLDLELPDKRDLYWEPMKFLTSVLDQARRGSLHPVLQRKVHSRPTDCLAKKKFKVGCVVASDLYYEADKQAGLQCRSITRAQAAHFVCRQSRVQKAAKKFGLQLTPTALKGWRREIREAPQGSVITIFEEIARVWAQKALKERGVKAAVAFVIGVHTNEQYIT